MFSGLFGTRQSIASLNEGGFTAGIGLSNTIKKITYSTEVQIGSAFELFDARYNEYQANILVGKKIKIGNRILVQPNVGIGCYIENKKNGSTNFKYVTKGALGLPVSFRVLYLIKYGAIGLNFGENVNSLVREFSYNIHFDINF